MGSIFRKTFTRPIPAGAKVEDGKAKWTPRGRRRPVEAEIVEMPDGRLAVRLESANYFAQYRDHDGIVRTVSTGTRDRGVAEMKLGELLRRAERIRAGVATAAEMELADHLGSDIGPHIADYVSTLHGSHAKTTGSYLRRLAADLGWRRLSDMRRDGLVLWLVEQARPGPGGSPGRSARSRLGFQRAATSFCNWLVEVRRLNDNPFKGLPVPNLKADRRRPRRALTPDELARLIRAATEAPERPRARDGGGSRRPEGRLSGPMRGVLYAFLAGTGLRINEVRQLRVADLVLGDDRPRILLPAAIAKNRDDGGIPLRDDLAEALRSVVAGRRPSDRVFPIPSDLIRRFRADCKRAGIPRYDDAGRQVDLHALRLTFGTMLAVAGVPLTTAQKLMRHEDPKLTANIYTDVRLLDLHGAVERLPAVPLPPATTPGNPASDAAPDAQNADPRRHPMASDGTRRRRRGGA